MFSHSCEDNCKQGNKKAFGRARKLLQYCHLPGKNYTRCLEDYLEYLALLEKNL